MGVKQAARHSVVAAKERIRYVVKAVSAQIVQTLLIPLKLQVYRENDEFIAASVEETISDSPLTEDFDDVMDWVFGHNPMDSDYEDIFDN